MSEELEQPDENVEDPIQEEVVEETPEEEVQTTVEMSVIDDMARDNGWTPDGELNSIDFMKKSKVFRDRQRDKFKKLSQENEEIYDLVNQQGFKQDTAIYKSENKDWETSRNEAIERGDVGEVNKLDAERPIPPQQQQRADPNEAYIHQWRAENTWFEDPENRSMALGFYQSVKIENGSDDPSVILPRVKQMMEAAFPDRFALPVNPNADLGAGVETGGRKSKNSNSGKLKRSDFPAEETAHFDQYIANGMKEDKLLASLAKLKRNG